MLKHILGFDDLEIVLNIKILYIFGENKVISGTANLIYDNAFCDLKTITHHQSTL